jgi:hypothetical protein
MITALLITFAIVVGGLITEMIAAANAPFGYQDESGFHFGQEYKLRGEDSGIQADLPCAGDNIVDPTVNRMARPPDVSFAVPENHQKKPLAGY